MVRLASGRRLRRTSRHAAPAMLGAQNHQCPEQGPALGAGQNQDGSARGYLDRTGRLPKRPSTSSSTNTGSSTAGRSNASPRIATRCWPSTISLPSIGITSARATPSKAPSPPSGTEPRGRKAAVATTAMIMVFKLVIAASKTWRRLKGTNQLPKVIAGVRFNDGIEVIRMPANHAA